MEAEAIQWAIDDEIKAGLSPYEARRRVMEYVEEAAQRQERRASAQIYAGCTSSLD